VLRIYILNFHVIKFLHTLQERWYTEQRLALSIIAACYIAYTIQIRFQFLISCVCILGSIL
jgi:hypothetical protein